MARLPQPGGDAGNWGSILNDYLATSHKADGTIKDNTIGATQLQDDSVTNAALADGSVTTSTIADGTITETLLAPPVQTKLNAPATIADGSITNPKLAADAVSKSQLQPALRAELDAKITQAAADTYYVERGLPTWGAGVRVFDRTLSAYNLRPDNLPKWRAAKARAAAGLGQAHVSTLLDSITHGANTATSNPKFTFSWPGRMRTGLQARLGSGGTGIVVPWDSMPDNPGSPPHDSRFVFAGAITSVAYGVYSKGAKRVTGVDGTLNYIEFTATCDEFWLYTLVSNGGSPRVQIDGGTINTIGAGGSSTTATYLPKPGYWGEGTTSGLVVSQIPAGALGQHTIRLMAPSSSGTLTIFGIEGRIAGKGVKVSNLAQSSRQMSELIADDAVNHFSGMSITFDTFRSDLAVLLVGMNDYQGHSPVATFKSRVATAIDRQRDTSTYSAKGDVVLVTCPQPNYAAPIPADGVLTPPLSDYYRALYELADEKDIPLIDVAWRWKDFATSNALGFFGDALHPNDLGSSDIEQTITNALLAV